MLSFWLLRSGFFFYFPAPSYLRTACLVRLGGKLDPYTATSFSIHQIRSERFFSPVQCRFSTSANVTAVHWMALVMKTILACHQTQGLKKKRKKEKKRKNLVQSQGLKTCATGNPSCNIKGIYVSRPGDALPAATRSRLNPGISPSQSGTRQKCHVTPATLQLPAPQY